jgi:hypothetical protein
VTHDRDGAIAAYRADLLAGYRSVKGTVWITVDLVRRALAGKDLLCICPLDLSCHADVLLEVANGGGGC